MSELRALDGPFCDWILIVVRRNVQIRPLLIKEV
jgi:hypothetical protein